MAIAKHLVGRVAEIDAFDRLLADLDRGQSAAIELVGEPGIGKTRLLSELCGRAGARAKLVLTGSASELEQDMPFGVFVDALDEYAHGLEPHRLEALDEDVRTELAAVLPAFSALAAGGEAVLQHDRYRSYRAVRKLLELLTTSKPLVLVLDDLHWADPGSVELLGALLRRPPAAPVLMALALRPRQVPERLSSALARAHRAGTLAHAELEALTRHEVRELLGDAAAEAEADGLFDESGGNPFYLEQLARAMDRAVPVSRGSPDISWADVDVPPLVAAALSEELALLSATARLVLEGAAVAGDPFEPELAAAAAATPEAAAIEALDELLRFDLVRGTEVPRRYRFRHPLLRRAAYESTPGGWRLGAHQRCAEALAARGAAAAARAHHLERSATQGDNEAVAVLRAAGEEAAQRTPAGAARWFAAALRLLGDSAPSEECVELLTALAGTEAATGHFAEARTALLQAIELLPDDPGGRVALTAACAGVEQLLGRHEEAHSRLVSAFEKLDEPRSAVAAGLMITLAMDAFYRQQHHDTRAWGERALDVATELGDRPLTAAALAAVALACAFTEAIADAELHRSRAAELIDAMPDPELAIRLDAIGYLTGAEVYLDRFEEATAHGRRGVSLARATGQGELLPMLTQGLGVAFVARGLLGEAAELLDATTEAARLSGNRQLLAWNLLNRAFVAANQGEVETALAAAEESVEVTQDLDESHISMYAGVNLAIARMESGNPEQAAKLFVEAAGGEGLPHVPGGWRAKYLELLTRCRITLGRIEEAERSAGFASAVATDTGLGTSIAWAERAAAAVAFARGDTVTAAEHALASAVAAEGAGAMLDAAVSRLLAGRALAQAGERDRAVEQLESAAAALAACGADRWRQEAEHELRKLGHGVHRRTRAGKADGTGVETLTERELQVARLIVDRNTNPEIAAALFLSPKTVETHIRNIFRKLGVTSRVQVARAVERADAAIR